MLGLGIVLAVQIIPMLWVRDLWIGDEVRHAAALMQMMNQGHWLVLHLSDQPYADKPPLYFLFLAFLATLFRSTGPPVFFVTVGISALFFLWTVVIMARRFGGGRWIALLAGLIILTNHYFMERIHSPRMDLTFAGFITLSHVCFFQTFVSRRPTVWAVYGFLTASLATLTKGPLGLALPLLAAAVFAVRQRRFKSLCQRGYFLGAALTLSILLCYLGGIIRFEGWPFLRELIMEQLVARAVESPKQSQPFFYYPLKLLDLGLPLTVIVFFMPWRRLARRDFWMKTFSSSPENRQGSAYLWCILVSGLFLLSCIDYKIIYYLLTLYPALAILIARHLIKMTRHRLSYLWLGVIIVFFLFLGVLPWVRHFTSWPEHVHGAWTILIPGVPCGIWLARIRRRGLLRFLGVLTLTAVLCTMPFYFVTVRGLNESMSPRRQARLLASYAEDGYPAFYYHPNLTGIYDYHAGRVITWIGEIEQLEEQVGQNPRGVVALRREDWQQWKSRPSDLELIDEQRLDVEHFMLFKWEPVSTH